MIIYFIFRKFDIIQRIMMQQILLYALLVELNKGLIKTHDIY